MHFRTLILILIFLLLSTDTTSAQSNNPRFGVIESYEAADAATELGVGWTRVRFPWAEVQPDGPEQWLPIVEDAEISAEIANTREVVGLLIGMPQWARDGADLPVGLYLDHTDPDNLWANYVREAVTRYNGQITNWIIWNEPDIWDEATPGYTWHGTEADFAQLMRVAYLTAKEANPDVVIHLASMTFFWDNNFGRTQYLDRLLETLKQDPEAAANGYYFDIATAHLYFQPNQMFDILGIWQGIMEKHGLADKPWWLVETNAPVVDDPSWPVDSVTFNVTQTDQANFMGQGIATAIAAGVDRVAIFKLIDTQSDRQANPEPFGLLRDDASPRDGFYAYQTVIDLFTDVTFAQRERWDSLAQIRLDHSDSGITHVLFARNGETQSVTIPASLPNAILYDTLGNPTTLSANGDSYTVDLPGSLCNEPVGDTCLIGGSTFYLVQREGNQTVSQPAVQPELFEATVNANEATVDFPNSMTFDLDFDSDVEIIGAKLDYHVEQFSCVDVETNVPVEVSPDGQASWTWQMVRSGNPPPGTDITWEWTLTDANGRIFTTPTESLTLSDDRFEWRTIESERINLHWYRGNDVGPVLLDSAESALARLERDMGIVLTDKVDIWVYGNSGDMRDAMLYVQGWAGGVAFSEYNTVLLGVEPSSLDSWGVRVIAHELAHLVTGQFGRSCVGGGRPTWLEEGLAMFAEGEPEDSTLKDISDGIDDQDLAPIRALTSGFPAHGASARDAYSQAWSIVDFLVAEYGAEKMQALILALADAKDTDAALEQVYGFNMDGLEMAWRTKIGADQREILPTVTPLLAEAIPTYPPIAGAVDVATPEVSESLGNSAETPADDGFSIPFCGSSLVLLFPAAIIFSRRKKYA